VAWVEGLSSEWGSISPGQGTFAPVPCETLPHSDDNRCKFDFVIVGVLRVWVGASFYVGWAGKHDSLRSHVCPYGGCGSGRMMTSVL